MQTFLRIEYEQVLYMLRKLHSVDLWRFCLISAVSYVFHFWLSGCEMMWLIWYGRKFQEFALLAHYLLWVSDGPFMFIPMKLNWNINEINNANQRDFVETALEEVGFFSFLYGSVPCHHK